MKRLWAYAACIYQGKALVLSLHGFLFELINQVQGEVPESDLGRAFNPSWAGERVQQPYIALLKLRGDKN